MSWNLISSIDNCGILSKKEATLFMQQGFVKPQDLLSIYPKRYEDRRRFDGFDSIHFDHPMCLRVQLVDARWRYAGSGIRYFEAQAKDLSSLTGAQISCRWFGMPWLSKTLAAGQELILYGKAKMYAKKPCMVQPEFEIVEQAPRPSLADEQEGLLSNMIPKNLASPSIHMERIVPIYPNIQGIAGRRFREIIWQLLERLDSLDITKQYDLTPKYSRPSALKDIHFPKTEKHYRNARMRFALEECFIQQLNVLWRKQQAYQTQGISTAQSSQLSKELAQSLPFQLTTAQKRCINEIYADMKRPRPMRRLLQGDVGSGKTLVALCAMLFAVEAGWQTALMAPTQILAEQHYKSFQKLLEPLDIHIRLLTSDKDESSGGYNSQDAQITIGTHALLFAKNTPEKLGLVVIDEQHKFGVQQREKLIQKGCNPDVLVMSATPIPRTLTLTLYGDLDVSIIDELPKGRGKIITALRNKKSLKKVISFVQSQLNEGRQIYIVAPLIDVSSSKETASAIQQLQNWTQLLPHENVALIHGRMNGSEKEDIMQQFHKKKIDVLVCTSVIEVGVDVPNASVMIINDAQSFGLSQLHQLRGRIGRGEHSSYCILLSEAKEGDEGYEKLAIIEKTLNGFEIAEADFKLRGPGDVLGNEQSGLQGIRFPEWLFNTKLIYRGRSLAEEIISNDPSLSLPKHSVLRQLMF